VTPQLVTVGGLTVDNVIGADGTVALRRAGGNSAYSAVGALCWVERVGVVSIAVSSYPRETLDRLASHGILFNGVVRADVSLQTGDWFIYDADGYRHERLRSRPEALSEAGFDKPKLTRDEIVRWERLLKERGPLPEISYSEFRDANPLRPEQVPASYLDARGVHLAPSRPVVLHGMLGLFGGRGMTITLDAGAQLADEPLDAIEPFLAQADAFLPSEVELRAIVPGAGLGEALQVLAGRCRGTVAVKLGPQGSLVWNRAKEEAVPVPACPTDAIDPTGAGDSYCGGFLAGLVETGDPVRAACFGTVSASLIVSRFGADGALPIDREACRKRLQDLVQTVDRARPAVATGR
jgi:sugar/nucleoside kinase (ribokinase family)